MRNKSYFITFEGTEGCGKSTQCRYLERYLKRRGFRVLLTQEPGGTVLGVRIRKLLLSEKSSMNPVSETLLYMASRAQLSREIIKPALEAGV